ncbi:MAG: MarR family transcriptional regulator [Clostridia bacterium]|nr:MarR family transcriptional regulator [Clostridia bacterium]
MNPENYEGLKLSNQLCFPLYAASREVIRKYRPYLDPLGLTYTQYIVMMVLWEEEKISVKELGRRLYLDSGTLTPVLKSLEEKGFVDRARSKEDERVLIARLTKEGLALKDRAKDVPAKVGGCVKLAPGEAVQLYSLLYKLLDGLED